MKPIVSICMMVKNEETNLERCLQSLQPLMQEIFSELIIVDTGSTDQTVMVAEKYTDKIYYHLWNDNFSEMRNISIGYATGEWVFIIDADEELENYEGIVRLLSLKPEKKVGCITLMVKNIIDLTSGLYAGALSPRIFRRNHGFCYQGVVHNEPVFKGIIIDSGNSLFHYGYIPSDKELMERKFQRTSMLLKQELEKNPNNIYYRYQLGITYSMHGERKISLREFETLYLQYQCDNGMLRKHIYIFGGLLQEYVANGQFGDEVVRAGLHGLQLEPEYIDLYSFLGKVYALRAEYEEAYSYFAKHVDLVSRFGDLKVRLNTAINHYTLNEQATDYYNMALMSYKNKEYDKIGIHIEQVLTLAGKNHALISRANNLMYEAEFHEKKYKNCQAIYEKLVTNDQQEERDFLEKQGEHHWKSLSVEERQSYCESFQYVSGLYGFLNRIRWQGKSISQDEWLNTLGNIDNSSFNELPIYYAPLFIYLMQVYPQEVWRYSSYFSEQTLVEYMKYMDEVDKSIFVNICRQFVVAVPSSESNQYQMARIQKNMAKYLLFSGVLNKEEYKDIFATYIEKGKYYLETLYSEMVFEQELVYDLKNREEIFLLYVILAERVKDNGKKYLHYLKKALAIYSEMHQGVDILVQSLSIQDNQSEMDKLLEQFLRQLETLIEEGLLDEALSAIQEYEGVIGVDPRLLLAKTEILKKKHELTKVIPLEQQVTNHG